jgi:hypothetical protein
MKIRTLGYAVVAALLAGVSVVSQSAAPSATPANTLALRIIVSSSAEEAERLVARLGKGENFVVLAQAESIDPSASQGGLLGRVDPASLRPELRDALRGVGPGQLTPVVRIPTGFAILKVVDDIDSTGATAANPAGIPALVAAGSVKYVLDVGGLPEAEEVLRQFPKPAGWDQDPRAICGVRRESLTAAVRRLDDFFAPAATARRSATSPFELLQTHFGLAQLLAYQGQMDRAVDHYEQAYQLARGEVPAAMLQMEETLGIAYLHKAEMDNDGFHAPGELCLIPPRPGHSHVDTAYARKAIDHLLRYLAQKPDELEVRWLLNLAFMTIGQYPAGVPASYLIPPAVFASGDEVGRFVDVAPQAGLNVFATAGGVIVDDLAGTGRFDVVTSNFDSCGPLHYFGNNGDGTFTERTAAAGLGDQLGGLNIVQTDYNNDSCKDILLLRGGWEVPQRKSLLRNNCNGTFTDVTADSGLATPVTSTQAAVWSDINNDGWLDLFIGNETGTAQLFLNNGNGGFRDISHAAGVDRRSYAKGVNAVDYDNDGYPDLYVSNFDGTNFLYRNNHDDTFSEMALAVGAPGSGRGFATWFFDYDNDGWMDLFATSYFLSVDETVRTYLGLPHNATSLKLYRNLGDGTFRDVTAALGLDKVFMPMGANFGDIDNDGFLDIYLGMGSPSYGSLLPHVLLRNQGGKAFVDVTASSGTGERHKGHGIAFADLDNDGDEDIVAEIGGATPGDSHAMRLFENPGHGNDWIALRLVGAKSNRAAIGARITVTVESDGGTRSIHRSVGSGGSFGASPLEQHVGLGKAVRNVALEIWWPTSNTRQRFAGVAKNQVVEITESESGYRALARRQVRLGGTRKAE